MLFQYAANFWTYRQLIYSLKLSTQKKISYKQHFLQSWLTIGSVFCLKEKNNLSIFIYLPIYIAFSYWTLLYKMSLIALISFFFGAWSVDMIPARREPGPVGSGPAHSSWTSACCSRPHPIQPAWSIDNSSGLLQRPTAAASDPSRPATFLCSVRRQLERPAAAAHSPSRPSTI